jgi:hypothetical protein
VLRFEVGRGGCSSQVQWWDADEVCSVGSNVLSRCSCLLICLAEVIVQVHKRWSSCCRWSRGVKVKRWCRGVER